MNSRAIEVVFTRKGSYREVTLQERYVEPEDPSLKPDVIHPTRLTKEEWESILSARTEDVQKILSNFFTA